MERERRRAKLLHLKNYLKTARKCKKSADCRVNIILLFQFIWFQSLSEVHLTLLKLSDLQLCLQSVQSLLPSTLHPPSLTHFVFFLHFFAFPRRRQRKLARHTVVFCIYSVVQICASFWPPRIIHLCMLVEIVFMCGLSSLCRFRVRDNVKVCSELWSPESWMQVWSWSFLL